MQNGECKFVRVPEGDYLRLVSEAKQSGEKDFPFTADELYTIGMALAQYYPTPHNSPLREKVNRMFEATLKR